MGHGVQSWMGQVGARAASPLTLLREYLTALRSLLDGQEVTTSGRYVKLDGVRLEWPPLAPPELLAGATGPLSLRLSGELADGTVLSADTNAEGVRRSSALIEQGRTPSGRDRHQVVVYLLAATGPGAEDRLLREYQRWGLEPGKQAGVAGDADEVARAVGELARAGAGTVVLQPTTDDPDMAGFARFVAQQVRPLVKSSAARGWVLSISLNKSMRNAVLLTAFRCRAPGLVRWRQDLPARNRAASGRGRWPDAGSRASPLAYRQENR